MLGEFVGDWPGERTLLRPAPTPAMPAGPGGGAAILLDAGATAGAFEAAIAGAPATGAIIEFFLTTAMICELCFLETVGEGGRPAAGAAESERCLACVRFRTSLASVIFSCSSRESA